MHYRSIAIMLLALSPLAALPFSAVAAESYDSCKGTITTLPATINAPGTWCLKQDLSSALASGNAITINADDVILDCNGFKLDGSAAGTATKANGIRSTKSGSTVRHCNVRGFNAGIYISGIIGGHVVEDNHLDGNTYMGIGVEGDGSVVRRNTVLDTGGSTVTTRAFGIYTRYSADVLDNTVSGVFATGGDTAGIYTHSNPSGSLDGNRVRGVLKSGTGIARGIDNVYSARITLNGNSIVGDGSASSTGVRCSGSNGRAKDNVIAGFVTSILSCGNAGGNDTGP